MVIPVNFIVGAAVGAVSTYVYKDEAAREWISDTTSKVKEKSSSFIASFKKKKDDADTDAQNVEIAEKESAEKQKDDKATAIAAELVEKESTEEQKVGKTATETQK